ncbi:MAG: hypothetical protein OXH13_02685 [Chloroflexi bacterium]|nr:hypothetical protein [Chloroflexota bacterium]MCY3696929.1 hypothetical protein [Chloroflexota bacterium]
MNHDDQAAIAVASTLTRRRAEALAREAAQLLDDAGVPFNQRTWIIASGADDLHTARIAAALVAAVGPSPLTLHDRTEPDGLIFQRRQPGQRRGGIYLNAEWQSASVRIACGDPLVLVEGLSGWFNPRETLSPEDLNATLLLGE